MLMIIYFCIFKGKSVRCANRRAHKFLKQKQKSNFFNFVYFFYCVVKMAKKKRQISPQFRDRDFFVHTTRWSNSDNHLNLFYFVQKNR
jgi:hypothetical protein